MSKRRLVLHLLLETGPRGVTTAEFLDPEAGCGSRFGARVQELRDEGWVIEARRVRAGSYRYVLHDSSPEPPADVDAGGPVQRDVSPPADVDAGEPARLFELPPLEIPDRYRDWEDAA